MRRARITFDGAYHHIINIMSRIKAPSPFYPG